MSRPDDDLLSLATSIADGASADWDRLEPTGDDVRRLLEALRLVARLKEWHAVADEPPGRWGHLEVLECIGAGGFGRVYRARDTVLDREVALKLTAVDPGRRDAALREARLLARVHHPNVVIVHGADHREGRVGIWMERVRGRTLQQLVRSGGAVQAGEAARIGIDLCRALAAVHEAGLVHRDVKAGNVMQDEGGRVLLMDFGAGRELDGAIQAASGTPLYMAPELWRGEPPTRESDLYAVGVLLYHLVTAAHPVEGATVEDVRQAHRHGRRVSLGRRRPGLPSGFVRAVDRALDPLPARRYRSAGEMEAALATSLGSRPHRHRWPFAAAGGVLSALILLLMARSMGDRRVDLGGQGRIGEASRGNDTKERAAGASVGATENGVAEPTGAPTDRGDPFVRPLGPERKPGDLAPDGGPDSPLYTIDAAIVGSGDPGPVWLRLQASEPLFVYVVTEEAPDRLALIFPLPGVLPVNPVPPTTVHRLPLARGPLFVVASPTRLAAFEEETRRMRVPGAGRTLTRIPLSEATTRALRSAFGDPSAFSRARPVRGHPEIVRGVWIRRADVD